MNLNVRLSEVAFLLLLSSAFFALGYQAGRSSAEPTTSRPANSGVANTR